MTRRSLGFGAAAGAYERFRPGYPDDLVDEVLEYAGKPVRKALEIGAGTGKATREFAARGISVTATDPDPAMLVELRRQVPAGVDTLEAAFEDLPLTPVYDLVFAAASMHWTSPDRRWPRVAAMLSDRGVFASFGGPVQLADRELETTVGEARSAFLGSDDVPSPDGTPADSLMQWPGTELARSDLFVDVRQSAFRRRLTISAPDYVGHLSTLSAYLELPEALRADALRRIWRVLPERVTVIADLTLHLARRGP